MAPPVAAVSRKKNGGCCGRGGRPRALLGAAGAGRTGCGAWTAPDGRRVVHVHQSYPSTLPVCRWNAAGGGRFVLTWQPLTRLFAGCAEPRSPAVHGRQRTALVPGQDGHGADGRDWPPTIAASQLPSGCRWLLTWHHLAGPHRSSGLEPECPRTGAGGTAVARLDPSKWRAAATRTFCEITGSRAGSGGDPAVQHATGCVGWPTAPVPVRGLFVGHRQTCTSGCTPSLRPSQWTLPGCWLAHSC